MDDYDEYKKLCMEQHHKDGDFVLLDTGFYAFWPKAETMGAMAGHHLRWVAEELDKLNAEHCRLIKNYFQSNVEREQRESDCSS